MMGRRVGDLLGQLGLSADFLNGGLGDLAKKGRSRLDALQLVFGRAATETNKFTAGLADGRSKIPPFGYNPRPNEARAQRSAFLAKTYAEPATGTAPTTREAFRALLDPRTRRAAMLTRLVAKDARVRSAVEKVAGCQVVLDGRTDGKLSLTEAPPKGAKISAQTASAPKKPTNIYDLFMQLDQEILKQANAMKPDDAGLVERSYGSILGGNPAGSRAFSTEDEDQDEFPSTRRGLTGPGGVDDLLDAQDKNTASEDVAALRIKRLNDKREQMYEIYNKTIEKYGSSARGAIDNLKA